jgi:hypothetical protein
MINLIRKLIYFLIISAICAYFYNLFEVDNLNGIYKVTAMYVGMTILFGYTILYLGIVILLIYDIYRFILSKDRKFLYHLGYDVLIPIICIYIFAPNIQL